MSNVRQVITRGEALTALLTEPRRFERSVSKVLRKVGPHVSDGALSAQLFVKWIAGRLLHCLGEELLFTQMVTNFLSCTRKT